MKRISLLIVLMLLAIVSYSDSKITRGPNIGEIYFIGPTHTGLGLYYSTDFGETAVCVDSTFTSSIMSICADKTQGVVYYVTMQEGLYISYDYGNMGSWDLRNGGIKIQINSGLQDSYIYSSFSKHSENYGLDFINHNYSGFFGNKLDVEIDNENGIGYTVVDKYNILDSLFLLISYDTFDSFVLKKSFEMSPGYGVRISRGFENGEMFLYNKLEGKLLLSQNYGITWTETNNLNTSLEFYDIVGGRNDKEIYILLKHVNMMWLNAHTYIYHSNDYGISFDVFHPFSKGKEPLLSNFSAKKADKEFLDLKNSDSVYYVSGEMPLNVHFYNYSIGEINTYEWDFNNDGNIDSNEENPVYTYVDKGWYSVNLTIYDGIDTNSFVKENYVHVYKITEIKENVGIVNKQISCYPNPFSKQITITYPQSNKSETNELIVYNNAGKIIKKIKSNSKKIIWDGSNNSGNKCLPGIYYITLNKSKYSSKVLLTY